MSVPLSVSSDDVGRNLHHALQLASDTVEHTRAADRGPAPLHGQRRGRGPQGIYHSRHVYVYVTCKMYRYVVFAYIFYGSMTL